MSSTLPANLAQLLGSYLETEANTRGIPDVQQSTVGGAVKGFGAGAATGNPWLMLGGGLLGGGAGLVQGLKSKAEQEKRDSYERMLPFMNAKDPDVQFAELGIFTVEGDDNTVLQAEKGENAVFPNMVISDVKADQKHEQMDKNEITEMVPGGTFIASADPSVKLTSEDIKDIVVGIGPVVYSEHESTGKIKKMYLTDIIGEGDILQSDAISKVKKAFPVSDREDDAFTVITNQENLEARKRYVDVIISLSEQKRAQKEGVDTESEEGVPKANDGMMTEYRRLSDLNEQDRERLRKMGFSTNDRIRTANDTAASLNFVSNTAMNLLSDPTETPAFRTDQGLEDVYRPIDRSVIDAQESKIDRSVDTTARALATSGASPAEIAALVSPIAQNAQDAKNDLGIQMIMANDQAEEKLALARNNNRNFNIAESARVENAERTNNNRRLRNQRRNNEELINALGSSDAMDAFRDFTLESDLTSQAQRQRSDDFRSIANMKEMDDSDNSVLDMLTPNTDLPIELPNNPVSVPDYDSVLDRFDPTIGLPNLGSESSVPELSRSDLPVLDTASASNPNSISDKDIAMATARVAAGMPEKEEDALAMPEVKQLLSYTPMNIPEDKEEELRRMADLYPAIMEKLSPAMYMYLFNDQ